MNKLMALQAKLNRGEAIDLVDLQGTQSPKKVEKAGNTQQKKATEGA